MSDREKITKIIFSLQPRYELNCVMMDRNSTTLNDFKLLYFIFKYYCIVYNVYLVIFTAVLLFTLFSVRFKCEYNGAKIVIF